MRARVLILLAAVVVVPSAGCWRHCCCCGDRDRIPPRDALKREDPPVELIPKGGAAYPTGPTVPAGPEAQPAPKPTGAYGGS